jgi:hypothetical protein
MHRDHFSKVHNAQANTHSGLASDRVGLTAIHGSEIVNMAGTEGRMLARSLDQFFTRPDIAALCVATLDQHLQAPSDDWLWIEPSAGGGVFYDLMRYPKIGLDILPQRADIMKTDFLRWHPGIVQRKIAVLGNPPFGKNASLARRFFDHAASFADVVAFIVPRTFEKPLFINRLDRRMHLVHTQLLEECAFEFEGEPYAVPTVFQIWEKRVALRPLAESVRTHRDFDFVAGPCADFAFQRVGARAGLVSVEGLSKSPQSHYFLKASAPKRAVFERLRAIDWEPIKRRTAGNPSIGKGELVAAYQAAHG